MSIDSNKKDFEKALEEMKETIVLLDYSVDESLMETLRCVVNEYEGHYCSDIDEAIDRIRELEDSINDLNDRLSDAQCD